MDSKRVLVVDDEETIRHVLGRMLRAKGCDVRVAGSAEEGLTLLREEAADAVLLDIVLPGRNGLETLGEIKRVSPDTEVVMMTSHASVETAVRAMRDGAYDYLQKPYEDLEDVWITVRRALERRDLLRSNRSLIDEQERRNRDLAAAVGRLRSMVEAGRVMAERHSVGGLLDFFTEFLGEQLGVDRVSLMLLDETSRQLGIASGRGLDGFAPENVRVELGQGIAGAVAQTGESFLVTDVDADSRVPGGKRRDLSNSFISAPIALSVPLKSSQRVLGVVNLTNRRNGQPLGTEDLNYVMALSSQLAVAIERARHLEELQGAYASLKATQDQLMFAERLKALGQMAAGVAHDFNNLLSIVLGKAQLATMAVAAHNGNAEKLRPYLETIQKAALQGAEAIRRIRNYTKTREDLPDLPIDLRVVVRDAVEMTRPKWKEEPEARGRPVRIEYRFEEVPAIVGNVHEITQVIGNLIFNAVEAMPDGGRLIFRTAMRDKRVVLEVQDSGAGMDEQAQARLFEPFFTTKPDGQGLGTSIVHEIVKRHGGEIRFESTPGRGTTFTVAFPPAPSGREEPTAVPAVADGDGRIVRVLLVDDNELVRQTYEEALQLRGHRVVSVASGAEALEVFDESEIDLVITDLSMDGMSGIEVATVIKQRTATVPVILLSGWGQDYVDRNVLQAGFDKVVEKPCPIDKLLEAVEQIARVSAVG